MDIPEPVTKEELFKALEMFIKRDMDAVNEYRNSEFTYMLDARVEFLSGRLSDACALLSMTVRHLTVTVTDGKAGWDEQTNDYRLRETVGGKLVLQRMFIVSDGTNCREEWRDQVTVTG